MGGRVSSNGWWKRQEDWETRVGWWDGEKGASEVGVAGAGGRSRCEEHGVGGVGVAGRHLGVDHCITYNLQPELGLGYRGGKGGVEQWRRQMWWACVVTFSLSVRAAGTFLYMEHR